MTKKHFIALADVLRATKPTGKTVDALAARIQWDSDVRAIAYLCQSQNSNFKLERWMDYIAGECGPNGGKVAR